MRKINIEHPINQLINEAVRGNTKPCSATYKVSQHLYMLPHIIVQSCH